MLTLALRRQRACCQLTTPPYAQPLDTRYERRRRRFSLRCCRDAPPMPLLIAAAMLQMPRHADDALFLSAAS